MDEQTRYALIGSCIILIIAGVVWFMIWMGQGSKKDYDQYVLFFRESVSGLLPKSSVSFNGVSVGSVDKIVIDPTNAKQVRVIIRVLSGTPINQSTTGQLDSMGITGVAYVSLRATAETAPAITHESASGIKVIPTEESLKASLSENVRSLAASLIEISKRLEHTFGPRNQKALGDTLQHFSQVTQTLADNRAQIVSLIHQANALTGNLSKASAELPQTIHRLNQMMKMLNKMGKTVTVTSRAVNKAAVSSNKAIGQINQQALPASTAMVNKISQVTAQLSQLIADLKANPSMLIRGRTPAMAGPGEK